jgi:hypothetical protein
MARAASGLIAEHVLATSGSRGIEAVTPGLGTEQAQLVIEQRSQLRRDQIWPLPDEQTDSRIGEVALAAHLADAHVAVPVRDGPIGCHGLEPHALQAVDGRDHDRQ